MIWDLNYVSNKTPVSLEWRLLMLSHSRGGTAQRAPEAALDRVHVRWRLEFFLRAHRR